MKTRPIHYMTEQFPNDTLIWIFLNLNYIHVLEAKLCWNKSIRLIFFRIKADMIGKDTETKKENKMMGVILKKLTLLQCVLYDVHTVNRFCFGITYTTKYTHHSVVTVTSRTTISTYSTKICARYHGIHVYWYDHCRTRHVPPIFFNVKTVWTYLKNCITYSEKCNNSKRENIEVVIYKRHFVHQYKFANA